MTFGIKKHGVSPDVNCPMISKIHLSPPELQDSIPNGADSSFQSGTFTRKTCATYLGALRIPEISPK